MSIRPPPILSDVIDPKKDPESKWNVISDIWGKWFHHFRNAYNAFISGLDSGSLLVSTDADGNLTDVDDLTDWVAGTANEITVTDDGDGTLTLSGAGSDTDFSVVVAIQAGGAGGVGFQYKTRALTLTGGVITTVGAESGWNDV